LKATRRTLSIGPWRFASPSGARPHGHKQPKKLDLESNQTIDVRTLSTGLLRQLAAEIKQQQARDRSPLTRGRPADD
jgi:hypothetical protein